jgi:AcrR family transcriptional regulator
MPIAKENNISSADRILRAATELFSSNAFNSVSVKDIATLSGTNGALISYYYGDKKNLYQAVLNSEAMVFLNLIEHVDSQPLSPLEKICLYVRNVADIQNQNPNQVNLVYRELLMPSGFCDNFVQSKLFKIHQFILEQVLQRG